MELIFFDSEPTSKFGGGIRTYLNLCLALCEENNIKTTLYTHNQNGYPSKYNVKPIQRLPLPNPLIRKILYKAAYPAVVALEYSNWIKTELLNSNYTKWLAEFCDFGGYAYYSLTHKKLKPHIVIRIHTPGFIIPYNHAHSPKSKIISLVEKCCLKKSEIKTAPSKYFVEENLPSVKKYIYLKNPLPSAVIQPANIPDFNVLRLIYIGRIEERKGVLVLLKALQKLSEFSITLTLAGSGLDTPYGEKVKSFSDKICHNKFEIKFISETSKEALTDICAKNEFAVFPSLFENSPYAFMEQLSRNLIPLGTSTGEMKVIQHELNYPAIIPGDINSLADGIKSLYLKCKNNQKVFFKYLENQQRWLVKNKPEIDKEWIQFYKRKLAG